MTISKPGTDTIIKKAFKRGMVVPGFNIPYLPMMEPVIRALQTLAPLG